MRKVLIKLEGEVEKGEKLENMVEKRVIKKELKKKEDEIGIKLIEEVRVENFEKRKEGVKVKMENGERMEKRILIEEDGDR